MSTETSSHSLKKPARPSWPSGSEKRNINIIQVHQDSKGSFEQNSSLDHPNLESSKRLSRSGRGRPVSDMRTEAFEITNGDRENIAEGVDNTRVGTGVESHHVKADEDVLDDGGSSNNRLEPGEGKERQKLITKIAKLRERHRDLAVTLDSLRDLDLMESNSYHEVLRRRNALSQALENAHRARLRVERDLDFFQTHSVLQDETLRQLESQRKDSAFHMKELQKKFNLVLEDKAQLAEDFRDHGLEHWVENSVKGTVNPIVLDAIMQGTGYVVEPMLDGIEKLATMNNEVASVVSRGITSRVSLASYPFYSGFVSYTVLLCPLVIVVSVLTRIKKGISRLSRTNWIALGTFYFLLVTAGCLAATIFGSVDVLQTFRLQNVHVFNSVLVIHGFTYFFYVLLHLYNLIQVPGQVAFSHFVVVTTIGIHFLLRSQKQSLKVEGLKVDMWTYIVYNAVLAFVLYETVFKTNGSTLSPKKGKIGSVPRNTVERCGLSANASNMYNMPQTHASGD
ncbi:hypothetical protein FGB62_47g010 [Gracilaria domingensis]|nr:hypothetical protein FGB62_47g010 [Gracilaria domingensis]